MSVRAYMEAHGLKENEMLYETVKVYSEKHNTTIRIAAKPQLTTVLELDRWKGNPSDDDPNVERIRFVVLLDTDMNEALRVQTDLAKGDERMLQALFDVLHLSGTHEAILGFDFFRNEPRVALYARYERKAVKP